MHDADLGRPKQAVALRGGDGTTLRGWYVPSRNRAAVIALHGTGSNRNGVAGDREARINRAFARRGGPAVEHWNLAGASHASAMRTESGEYERRVVGFLDRSLRR